MKHLALCLLLLLAAPLGARCLVPLDYPGQVKQDRQQVLILHRAKVGDAPGYQEMILRVTPYFDGAENNPASLAWIITVPSKPLRYDIAPEAALASGGELHARLYALAREQWANRSQFEIPSWMDWMTPGRDEQPFTEDVVLRPTVDVGPYSVTPIRAAGADGLSAVNDWLDARGFASIAPEGMGYFVEQDFTYLCVQITPPAGAASALKLQPLVIGFETEHPYYPARLCDTQGDFALDLTLITDTPLHTRYLRETRTRLKAHGRGYVELVNLYTLQGLPAGLQDAVGERFKKDLPLRLYANRIESKGFNSGAEGVDIAKWEDDVFVRTGTYQDELPGFWFYSDADISMVERFMRHHALAVALWAGVLLFSTLFIKTRINRRRMLAEREK